MLSILLTLTLLTLSTALPAPVPETWTIPSLTLHMMTRLTGLPGSQPWPNSTLFPSTIAFDIAMPDATTAHCAAEWANGTLPDGLRGCTGEGVRFGMRRFEGLGGRRAELGFLLRVERVLVGNQQTILTGEVAITANDPSEPSSYLTCLLGAPFDGLRCSIAGPMSVSRALVIEARVQEDIDTGTGTDQTGPVGASLDS